MQHITSIRFHNYKSFSQFSLTLTQFNILVGPNNAGKSTVIGALKILSEGLRKARARKPIVIECPKGIEVYGYQIDLSQVPVATENVFHNYDDESPAIIRFRLSDGAFLQVFFPRRGECYMNYESEKRIITSPSEFKKYVEIEIGYVPILGPVEHTEPLYQKEAARLALLSHTASRNFRNIWFHYDEDFPAFRELILQTWPGMDISLPEVNRSSKTTTLDMFCPEERIPREIFWAGFGFQVWCQMLTYIVKNKTSSVFLIDEPDIYLHSDLQRQLLGILKNLGPDIIIATHSTELISEADLNDILVINKVNQSAQRIKDPTQLIDIFQVLGSNLNPVLTQIAKSKRVLFVEGKDFSVLSKIARRMNREQVANRSDFAVVPVEGFNPIRLKAFKEGIEKTIGSKILSAVIFDKDYRSDLEVTAEKKDLEKISVFAHIHSCKEIENFLIIPTAIEKAIKERILEFNNRNGKSIEFKEEICQLLGEISNEYKHKTQAQLQTHQFRYEKSKDPKAYDSIIVEKILKQFESAWSNLEQRFKMLPGKDFLSSLNKTLQEKYGIGITQGNIINHLQRSMIPDELKILIDQIDQFRKTLLLVDKV